MFLTIDFGMIFVTSMAGFTLVMTIVLAITL